jgi:FK506-binding nuclear protein
MDTRFPIWALAIIVLLLGGCHDRSVNIEETPIKIVSDEPGRGRVAVNGRVVNIDYEVTMPNGDVLMRHKDWTFALGAGAVVLGMEEGVLGMRPGGRRVIECPAHKHWGRNGYADGLIPPNTTLLFHVKMNRVD